MAKAKELKDNVTIYFPVRVLALLDRYAQQNDLDRSQVVTRAAKEYLLRQFGKDSSLLDELYDRLEKEGKV